MILDTIALSAAAADNNDPAVIALLADADELAIPVIVLGEFRYGIAQSRNRASYTTWLKGLLQDCLLLDVYEPATHHYAQITRELKQKGRPIPTNDIWIAALCRQHQLPLLSRARHFDLVAGNKRIGW